MLCGKVMVNLDVAVFRPGTPPSGVGVARASELGCETRQPSLHIGHWLTRCFSPRDFAFWIKAVYTVDLVLHRPPRFWIYIERANEDRSFPRTEKSLSRAEVWPGLPLGSTRGARQPVAASCSRATSEGQDDTGLFFILPSVTSALRSTPVLGQQGPTVHAASPH